MNNNDGDGSRIQLMIVSHQFCVVHNDVINSLDAYYLRCFWCKICSNFFRHLEFTQEFVKIGLDSYSRSNNFN